MNFNSSTPKSPHVTVISWPKALFLALEDILTSSRKPREILFKVFIACSLIMPPMWFYMGGSRVVDYSAPIPSLKESHFTEGELDEVRITKQYFWQVVSSDGREIYLRPHGYKWQPNRNLPKPMVKVYWYKLPSGVGGVVQMEMNGVMLIDREQANLTRKESLKYFSRSICYAVVLWLIGLTIFIRKASRIRNNPVTNKEESK